MSHYLEAAATLDPIRAKHLAQTDAVRFTEEQLLAADEERATDKAHKLLARDVRISHEQDLVLLRAGGWV